MNRRSNNLAFTLIEILIVIVIMGIAAAMVIPQMSAGHTLRASAAARTVMSDLIYAQNLAIATQVKQYVRFTDVGTATPSYAVCQRLPVVQNTDYVTHPVRHDPYINHFGAGGTYGLTECQISSINFNGKTTLTAIAFDSLGSPFVCNASGTGEESLNIGQIDVQSGELVLRIDIEPFTGEISVQQVVNP